MNLIVLPHLPHLPYEGTVMNEVGVVGNHYTPKRKRVSSSGGERCSPAYLALRVCFLCLFGSGPIVTSPCLALLPHLPHVPDHPPVVSPSCRSHPPATELMLASVTLCQLNRNHAGQIEAALRHFSLQWLGFFLGKMLNKLGLSLCQAQD